MFNLWIDDLNESDSENIQWMNAEIWAAVSKESPWITSPYRSDYARDGICRTLIKHDTICIAKFLTDPSLKTEEPGT